VNVTAGYVFGLPVGITFMASAWSEPTLIRIASGFEAAANVQRAPRFLRTFKPEDSGDRGRDKAARAFAASAMQKHGAKLDQFLVPRLRRLNHL
jgi:hypothetical protein